MFGFFTGKATSPIDKETRIWMEEAFTWLVEEFDSSKLPERTIFLPTQEYFPINYSGAREAGNQTLEIIATAMEIDIDTIELEYFHSGIKEFAMGDGNIIFTQQDEKKKSAAGLYFEKDENGKYLIAVDEALLSQPEVLVATLAHELAHIKLLGEQRVDFNDEHLTDLVTTIFGFGLFNANCAFQFNQSFDRWSHSNLGYLSQMEWGYALALLALLRKEENPEWLKYLNKTIKSDFKQSQRFIKENPDKVLQKN